MSLPTGKMYKLGGTVLDSATGAEGMLTHYQIEANRARFYRFQPRGVNRLNGSPIKGTWIAPERVVRGVMVDEPALPLEVIGTAVEDEASGFKGVAITVALHISGCVHIVVQGSGKVEETGELMAAHEFDYRRLKGAAIKPMTEAAREADQVVRPSPMEVEPYSPGEI